jgi:hypothetical protein
MRVKAHYLVDLFTSYKFVIKLSLLIDNRLKVIISQ